MRGELEQQSQRIEQTEQMPQQRARECAVIRRLMTIPGIGILTATALAAASGNPKEFKNGRRFAAWPGLVPRRYSSGGKSRLWGISKRGDR